MKRIVLSTVAALAVASTLSASALTLYTDESTGQVFTQPGEGRVEMGEFTEKTKDQASFTSVSAKASKLKFSGTHYLGYTYTDESSLSAADGGPKAQVNTGNFEMRRNYVQVKAYFLEDPKSYARVTLDATYSGDGHADVYVKYAYLYLNDVLPFTGVEFGMAHRPWVDYEEHQGWLMRSISKTFIEASESAHLTNSSGLGFNFKTKTDYFTSEIGIFNGEGSHGESKTHSIGTGNSLEWRATVAAMGNGTKHRKATKDTYLDASFFGQYNVLNSENGENTGTAAVPNMQAKTYSFYGAHAVYNMPNFLFSAQYIKADNDNKSSSQFNGDGFSVNTTGRFGSKKQYSIFGRFDRWHSENQLAIQTEQDTNNIIYGLAWEQNKNVKWLLSGQSFQALDHRNYKSAPVQNWNAGMLTAEVKW